MPISTPSTSLGTATVEVDALVVGAGAAGMTAALVSSLEGLDVMLLTGQTDTPLPLLVSLANRFLIVTYCIWLMAAAWAAAWKRPYSPAPRR
jgi:2-polyprenyl-6-methoxyphenol hydroxylase-like FAD-dependent oxidoreductase